MKAAVQVSEHARLRVSEHARLRVSEHARLRVSEHARLRKHLIVDSRLRGNDKKGWSLTFYEFIKAVLTSLPCSGLMGFFGHTHFLRRYEN